jgi:hypothetical protein
VLDERPVRPAAATQARRVRRAAGTEGTLAPPRTGTEFSPFLPEDARRPWEAARGLMITANAAPDRDAALDAVAAHVDELGRTEHVGVVRLAEKLFLTHHPACRDIRIPALQQRGTAEGGALRAARRPSSGGHGTGGNGRRGRTAELVTRGLQSEQRTPQPLARGLPDQRHP